MSSIPAIASASLGLQQNLRQFDDAARRVSSTLDSDLARGVVDLKQAQHGIAVNAAVLRAADESVATLIDILV